MSVFARLNSKYDYIVPPSGDGEGDGEFVFPYSEPPISCMSLLCIGKKENDDSVTYDLLVFGESVISPESDPSDPFISCEISCMEVWPPVLEGQVEDRAGGAEIEG